MEKEDEIIYVLFLFFNRSEHKKTLCYVQYLSVGSMNQTCGVFSMKKISIVAMLLVVSQGVSALENFVGKVTLVEPTYLPTSVSFKLDTGNTTCPAGTTIKWNKNDSDNNLAVYSTLLAALVSGTDIRIFIDDGDTECNGRYMHLSN